MGARARGEFSEAVKKKITVNRDSTKVTQRDILPTYRFVKVGPKGSILAAGPERATQIEILLKERNRLNNAIEEAVQIAQQCRAALKRVESEIALLKVL